MKTIPRRHGFSLFNELDRGLNLLVNEVFAPDHESGRRLPVTVLESDQSYHVETDLPGVALSDIHVEFDDGTLQIKAQRKATEASEGVEVTADERHYGEVHRSIRFGKDVNADSVDAELDNGVLTITVDKVAEVQPRKITIRKA